LFGENIHGIKGRNESASESKSPEITRTRDHHEGDHFSLFVQQGFEFVPLHPLFHHDKIVIPEQNEAEPWMRHVF
jgi:hypothetical protein